MPIHRPADREGTTFFVRGIRRGNRNVSLGELDGFGDVVRRGTGGLGDVYQAIRLSTGAPVAIKVLRDWSDQSVAWHRAQRELRALVDLKGHPHVVHVEEVIEVDDVPHLVMEFAPGGSLSELMSARGAPLTVPEVVLVGEQTTSALAASHRLGIIHLDIKPQNLLIGSFGQVKVCDFGIAALTATEQFRDRTSALSYRYASPEQLADRQDIGAPADVYSLGATLVHLLTGEPPVISSSVSAGSVPFPWSPPDHLHGEAIDALRSTLDDCLDVDPVRRPSADLLNERFDGIGRMLGALRSRSLMDIAGMHPDRTVLRPGVPRRVSGQTDPSDRHGAGTATPSDPRRVNPSGASSAPGRATTASDDVPTWILWTIGALTILTASTAIAIVLFGR